MPLNETTSNLTIDIRGATETTRYDFHQNQYGDLKLSSKKIYANFDHELKLNQNRNVSLSLDIKDKRNVTTSIINTFILTNYLTLSLKGVKHSDTIVDDYFTIMKKSNASAIPITANISVATPISSYPVVKTILSNKVNPSLSLNLSDQIVKGFHELSHNIAMTLVDQPPSRTEIRNFTLRPFDTSPGTAIALSLALKDKKQPENINLNYTTVLKYNSSANIVLGMNISEVDVSPTVTGGLTHTMKIMTSSSISLKLRVREGDISYSTGNIHTLKYANNDSITLDLAIFDWIRTPGYNYRYQNWLDY